MKMKEAEMYLVQVWRASDNRILKREWRNANGDLHNPDGPALETWDELTGVKTYEDYFQNGLKHRLEGPASIVWDATTGRKTAECWRQNGRLHRDGDKPAAMQIDSETGMIIDVAFIKNGQYHRDNGPATVVYSREGGRDEVWMRYGKTHRSGGLPAIVQLDNQNNVVSRSFWENDQEIRGPIKCEGICGNHLRP